MVGHRDGVIAELKDEAYTLWASGWLAFQRRAVKAFPGLDFDFPTPDPDEEEVKESISEDEADPEVSSDTPALFLFLVKLRFLSGLALPSRPLRLQLLTYTAWRLALLRLLVAPPQKFRPLRIIFAHFG